VREVVGRLLRTNCYGKSSRAADEIKAELLRAGRWGKAKLSRQCDVNPVGSGSRWSFSGRAAQPGRGGSETTRNHRTEAGARKKRYVRRRRISTNVKPGDDVARVVPLPGSRSESVRLPQHPPMANNCLRWYGAIPRVEEATEAASRIVKMQLRGGGDKSRDPLIFRRVPRIGSG